MLQRTSLSAGRLLRYKHSISSLQCTISANNGTIFLFARSSAYKSIVEPCKNASEPVISSKYYLVKMISPSAKDRVAISCVSIDPFQKHLIAGTCRGAIYGIQLTEYHKIGEKIEFTHDFHSGFAITCLLWDTSGTRIFSACSSGSVCATMMREGVSAYFGATHTELLLKEDTGIVQLDYHKDEDVELLLVSSQQRSMTLDLSALEGNAIQIGTKARHGTFGGCFGVLSNAKKPVMLYCTRPGRRIWVADPLSGNVSSTLKFPIDKAPDLFLQDTHCVGNEHNPKDISLSQLARFQFRQEPYLKDSNQSASPQLVSWMIGSSALFFLDPISVEVVEWHTDLGVIHDLKVLDEHTLITLHGPERLISFVHSCSAFQFLELYAEKDLERSIKLAIDYNINDAWVLEVLRGRWIKEMEVDKEKEEYGKVREKLEELIRQAKQLLDEFRADHEDIDQYVEAQPLHVIYKQRPVKQVAKAFPTELIPYDTQQETVIIKGKRIHKESRYFQIEAAPHSSVRGIDASPPQAHLASISDLSPNTVILEERYKLIWQQQISTALSLMNVSESSIKDQSTWRQTFNISTKALITFLPNSLALPGFTHSSDEVKDGAEADYSCEVYCDPLAFEGLELEPEKPFKNSFLVQNSILRMAVSASSDVERSKGSEMLLEAISDSLWTSTLKFDSKLPLHEQLRFVELQKIEEISRGQDDKVDDVSESLPNKPIAKTLPLSPKSSQKSSVHSPKTAKPRRRRMQTFGATPAFEVRKRCLIGGQMARSVELESIQRRDIAELRAELAAAACTANSNRMAKRIWPASGITRICACLANLYLQNGDIKGTQSVIQQWLQCFDPHAQLGVAGESKKELDTESNWARGKLLVDGDGLPLTRSDWNFVRLLISLFFTTQTIGSFQHVVPPSESIEDTLFIDAFAEELGIVFVISSTETCTLEKWDSIEAQHFIDKYGSYLNLEIAAQVCIIREFPSVLDAILNEIVSGTSMSSLCTSIIDWIAEDHIESSIQTLIESKSLCLLLHVLDLLFKKAPEEASKICVDWYPMLQPWNIRRILFGAKTDRLDMSDLVRSEHSRAQALKYFAYLVQLLQCKRELAIKSENIVKHCFKIVCADKCAAELITKEYTGKRCSEWLQNILCIGTDPCAIDRDWCWDLMVAHSELPALMELCIGSLAATETMTQGLEQVRSIIAIVSEKAEHCSLVEPFIRGIAMHAKGSVGKALETIFDQAQKSIASSQKPMLVSSVFSSILSVFGPDTSYDYLCRYADFAANMPYSAFQSMARVLTLKEIEEQQLYQMLEIMDAHVWRPGLNPLFPPQLQAVFELERGASHMPIQVESCENAFKLEDTHSSIDTEINLRRLYEYRNSAWGGEIQLHDSVCTVCDLPLILVTEVENENVSVIFLSCGHAFHASCVPDELCCICLQMDCSL